MALFDGIWDFFSWVVTDTNDCNEDNVGFFDLIDILIVFDCEVILEIQLFVA